jgi:type IV pilus assembly protein PilV
MTSPSRLNVRLHSVQAGMTLVEVLVTLVLISVGLLGVAALHIASLKSNQEAYVRSQASVLAGDILDRMRANRTAAAQYAVALNGTGTSGTTAGNDLTAWQNEINRLLPGGAAVAGGQIAITNPIPAVAIATITIQWTERASDAYRSDNSANAAANITFRTRTEL